MAANWSDQRTRVLYRIAVVVFLLYFNLSHIKTFCNPLLYWSMGLLPLLVTAPRLVTQYRLQRLMDGRLYSRPMRWWLFFWAVFICGVGASAAFNQWQGLYTIPKYAVIALLGVYFFWLPPIHRTLLLALKIWCLASLVVMGVVIAFGFDGLLVVYKDVRLGWKLSPPGVLWKAGIFLVPYFLWPLSREPHLRGWLWLTAACTLIRLDGSRSGSIIVFLMIGLVFVFSFVNMSLHGMKPRTRHTTIRLLAVLAAVLAATLLAFAIIGSTAMAGVLLVLATVLLIPNACYAKLNQISFPKRSVSMAVLGLVVFLGGFFVSLNHLYSLSPSFLISGLRGMEDSTRTKLIYAGIDSAIANFPVGAGFQNTRIPPEHPGHEPQVVHMTYLQIWADLGVISLFGYLGALILPLLRWKACLIRNPLTREAGALVILPIGIIVIYLVNGLFHPISNELSEWAVVVVASGLLIQQMKGAEVERPGRS